MLISQPCQKSKLFEAILQEEQECSVECVPNRDIAMNHQVFLRHFCKGYNPLLMIDCLVPWVRMKKLSELFACGCACWSLGSWKTGGGKVFPPFMAKLHTTSPVPHRRQKLSQVRLSCQLQLYQGMTTWIFPESVASLCQLVSQSGSQSFNQVLFLLSDGEAACQGGDGQEASGTASRLHRKSQDHQHWCGFRGEKPQVWWQGESVFVMACECVFSLLVVATQCRCFQSVHQRAALWWQTTIPFVRPLLYRIIFFVLSM